MAYKMVGETAHEWIGIGVFVLFVCHHVLNLHWGKQLGRGKYSSFRICQTILVILLFSCMIGLAWSGIILSRHVFAGLPLRGAKSVAHVLHLICSFWGFALMGVHLGLHWNMVMGIVRKKTGCGSRLRTLMLRILAVLTALYGIYAFIDRQTGRYMLLQSHFVFYNPVEPLFYFLADYTAIMALFVFLGHYLAKILRLWDNRRRTVR